jgi:hypothetical protein
MITGRSLLAHWYYHVPDLVLALLTYLVIARLAVSLLLGRRSEAVLLRALAVATAPVLVPVGALTPRMVPAPLVAVFALAWLLALRLMLFMGVSATGVRLSWLG